MVVQRIDSADTSRKIKKKINKYIKIGEKIVEYQNIPDWTCPKDVLARWFWAYRKILQRVRRKDMKIGFSATRIQQHQTISGKLDLIDNELFHLSSSTSTKFDRLKKDLFEQINQQSEKFNQKIDDVYHQQEQLKENHNRRLDDLTVALSSFQNETNEVIQLLKAQQSTNLQTLMEDVERLKARLNFQEDFYLRMKNEELERYQQQTSTLVEESLSLGQSLSLILQCKRNDPIDAFPAKSLYSEVQLTSEYLSDYHCLLDTLKQVFQKDQEVKLIRDSAIALQAKSMYLDRSLVNMEAELTAIQQRSKTHPQESMNHSSFASVAIAVIPTFRDRLKEFEGNLNWTTRGISHHESVLFSLLDRLLNHSEKAFDDFQRQQGQSHVLKDRFDHLTRSFETLETKNTNLITTIYKVENDIVDLNRQCYVLNNYNKRKISVDLLADDIEGLKAQLVGLKGDISHAQYHYDDSVCDNQSQISNPDPFHFEDDHPVETVEAESEVKEEMINSPPLEEPNLERNSVETSEDCTGLDQLLENEITDSIEEKKDGKPSSSHRKNSSLPREKDNKDAKSRPSTGNGENDEILATTSQRKGEHQRSAKGRRKSTQEKQKSTPPKEQLESLISKICSEQLQNAMREYMSHSPAVITQIGFNHQPNQTTNTQPSSQNRIKDSIAKAIQQAEVYENDEQPVTTTISTEDSLLFKKKRKPNSALMGSFIDYDTRKSFPSSTGAEPPTTTISVRLKSPSSENGHITTNSYNNILGIPTTTSFDPSPIIGDISTLKEEIGGLRHFVTSVNDDKITREEVKDLFFDLFRDQRKRDIKQENNRTQHLDELQKSLQDLNREFTNMKSNQDFFAHQLKVDVDGIMNKLLVKISHEVSESQKDSVFSTKGLCLGCGRVSNVRTQPSSRATSPPFLPALNNHITPGRYTNYIVNVNAHLSNQLIGPEIYRGGFRMLGHSNSPQLNQASQLTAQSFPLDGESSLLQQSHVGKEVPLLLRNKVMTLPEAQQREQHPYKDFRKDFESFNPTVVSLATPSMLNSNVDGSSIMTEDLNQRKIPENEKETSNAELHLTMPALQYSDQINFDFDAGSKKFDCFRDLVCSSLYRFY